MARRAEEKERLEKELAQQESEQKMAEEHAAAAKAIAELQSQSVDDNSDTGSEDIEFASLANQERPKTPVSMALFCVTFVV